MGATVANGSAEVQTQFVRSIQRRHHRQVEQTTRLCRQTRASPNRSPAEFSDQLLERLQELVGVRHRVIDVIVAEDLTTDGETLVKATGHETTPFVQNGKSAKRVD